MDTNLPEHGLRVLDRSVDKLVHTLFAHDRRVLLFGRAGVGKSTLAEQVGQAIAATGRTCWCLSADPGSPAFGVPGAVSLGRWTDTGWRVVRYEALCTLDAGRFRLPLISALRRLSAESLDGVVLIDGPGAVRGVAGAELLHGLVEACAVDVVLAAVPPEQPVPLLDELKALSTEVFVVHAASEAKRPGKRIRGRLRTAQWDGFFTQVREQQLDLRKVNLVGTPPPDEPSAWVGRQLGLLRQNQLETMGEVLDLHDGILTVKVPVITAAVDTLLIRDAQRNTDGVMETAAPFVSKPLEYLPAMESLPPSEVNGGPRVVGRVGPVDVTLMNGVFGDPLLHVRFRHRPRSLLFDLGEGRRLSARLAHQVSDVFISHAHLDHIGGFLWLLRSRIGDFPICRLYGPPGLLGHVESLINGVLWDRVADRGPRFEVAELHGSHLKRFYLQAGSPGHRVLDDVPVVDDVVLSETGFRVRAVLLDHKTPVLAYALEPERDINIRKDRLVTRNLTPGPWLNELKQQLLARNETARIHLPDGTEASVAALARELVLIRPTKKLVYATDLADTEQNRERLQALAHHAHTFFCEAPFIEADSDRAQRHGHLTTRACGEIAVAAGVARLLPFHFSRRNMAHPQQVYDEIMAVCPQVVVPESMHVFATGNSVHD